MNRSAHIAIGLLLGIAVAFSPSWATADTISIFNSGVDASGNVLAPGAADPHYDVTVSADGGFATPAPAIVQLNHPAWLANSPTGGPGSSWISTTQNGATNISHGDYEFQTQFDLAGLDPATAAITAQVAVDNSLTDVRLNGTLLGISRGGFSAFQAPFTIDSGFVAGVNTLEFLVNNAGGSPNPGGFRVEILSAEAQPVPEPSTLVLTAFALLGLIGCAFRKR